MKISKTKYIITTCDDYGNTLYLTNYARFLPYDIINPAKYNIKEFSSKKSATTWFKQHLRYIAYMNNIDTKIYTLDNIVIKPIIYTATIPN